MDISTSLSTSLYVNGTSLTSLVLLSAFFGAKHGLDADHLAAIDGLSRLHPQRSRLNVGAFFSLGHGLVILLVACSAVFVAAQLGKQLVLPAWLGVSGMATSLVLLLLLGVLNLRLLLSTPHDQVVPSLSIRAAWLHKLKLSRLGILGTGGLMAISLDTLTQALLFASFGASSAATQLGIAALLALSFTLGMVVSDGFNGWLVSRLLKRSDQTAASASRWMCRGIVLISFLVAVSVFVRLLAAITGRNFDALEASAWAVSFLVFAVLVSAFWLGQTRQRLR